MLSCRFLTDISKTLLRAFKQGTAGCFISRDIRSTSGQTFGYPTLLNKVGLFCNFWLWLLVILMPLEIYLQKANLDIGYMYQNLFMHIHIFNTIQIEGFYRNVASNYMVYLWLTFLMHDPNITFGHQITRYFYIVYASM